MSDLDAADLLATYRKRFAPMPGVRAYLDGNSLGRPLIASMERVAAFLNDEWAVRLIRGWDDGWMSLPLTIGLDRRPTDPTSLPFPSINHCLQLKVTRLTLRIGEIT